LFKRQVISKQPIAGTLVITLMLIATAIFFIGIVPERASAAYSPKWRNARLNKEIENESRK